MLQKRLHKLLLEHPEEIGETYLEHAAHALWIGLRLIGAGFACLLHALLPGLCIRTASGTVAAITKLMHTRTDKTNRQSVEHVPG